MTYFYATCTVRVTIFSTGGKFRPVSILRSYTLLLKSPVLMRSWILEWPKTHQWVMNLSGYSNRGGWVFPLESQNAIETLQIKFCQCIYCHCKELLQE